MNDESLLGEREALRPSVLNPGRLVQGLMDTFRPVAIRKKLELKVESCSDWHDVVGDEPKIWSILSSLLADALARTTTGWVRLSIKPPDGQHWSIIIEDTDNSIPSSSSEPPSGTGDHVPGSGLSLAACQRLANRMLGTLSSKTMAGNGTRTETRLPVMLRGSDARVPNEPTKLGQTPEPQNCHRSESESVNNPLRLLVVEDHDDLCVLLGTFFEGLGYQARVAGDLASALRIADEELFDVLLSDIALPDGDGWELLQRLGQSGHRPRYAIAMSGFYGVAGYARSKEAGFAVHLVKPFAPAALEKALAVAGQAIALDELPGRS